MLVKQFDISSPYGTRSIEVYNTCIENLSFPVDILTVSAYERNYYPLRGTMIGALDDKFHISVTQLSRNPEIDLRDLCDVWLSRKILSGRSQIGRIGCIELCALGSAYSCTRNTVLDRVTAYFKMLSIAGISNIPVETVLLPVIGTGSQKMSTNLVLTPLIRECINYLKTSQNTKRIIFCERSSEKALAIAKLLDQSCGPLPGKIHSEKTAKSPCAFISYSSKDKNIADNLCAKLEQAGIRVWYAPRNVTGDYASAIYKAIASCSHFVVFLSANSLSSQHVLNEIDLAFQRLPDIIIKPLRLDETELGPAFQYYLSRQHWMDATIPPLERRLTEFVQQFQN